MNTTIRIAGMLLLATMISKAGFAQSHTPASRKQEMLQRMLKEKLHLPGKVAEDDDKAWRTTAATDGRVSAAANNIGEGEISMAYNPADSNQLVISYMEQTATGLDFPIYYSGNGGSTWTRSPFSSASILSSDFPGQFAAGGGDPVFAWDKNGTLYFGWIYLSVPSSFDTAFFTLNWAYSTDNGHTWNVKPKHFIGEGAVDVVNNTTFDYKDGITDREWFAVDNSGGPHQGNLYCSFVCFPAGSIPPFEGMKTKVAGVDTFGPAVHGFDGDSQFGNLEVDKNGVVHMSMADVGNSKIRHTKSTDGGASFAPTVVVSNTTVVFPGPPFIVHNRENAAVNMAVDGKTGTGNNVHIVWSDFPGTTVNSFYSHSGDGGATWSTPISLDSLMPGKLTLMPTVAAEGNNVSVSYTAIGADDSAEYYQINSTDNGASFGAPRLLSSAPCNYNAIGAASESSTLFFGDYNRSVRTTCEAFASWEDCRNNIESKVYFARTNYCAVGVREVSLVNGTSQLLAMFPNPASEQITLTINSSVQQQVSVTVTDMTGRVQLASKHQLQSGRQEVTVPLNGLAKGAYAVTLANNEGIIATRTLIVR